MKKYLWKYWISLIMIIGMTLLSGSININIQSEIPQPQTERVRISEKEFQALLEEIVAAENKMREAYKEARSREVDLQQFQKKRKWNLTNLEASVLEDIYEKRFFTTVSRLREYRHKYHFHKLQMEKLLKKIPSDRKDFFRSYLIDMKRNPPPEYSEQLREIFKMELKNLESKI